MKYKGRHPELKKLLIQRLAFIIAVFYMLSPFQQQLSTVLHSLSHDLSLPDYVMTHSRDFSKGDIKTHQYGDHRTGEIIHEHQIIDFVQSLLENSSENEHQPDPIIPANTIDKHLVIYSYTLKNEFNFEHKYIPMTPKQNTCNGHTNLWQEPPISTLL